MTDLDLCVVNFNTKHCLIRLFQKLWSKEGDYPFRMYLADNGSTDGSVEYLKEFARPSFIKEIVFNTNIGYAAACNRLGSRGVGDIIGFLNADVWLTTEDVKKIQDSFDKHPDMAIMGPKQRDEQGLIRHAGITGTNTEPKHRGWGWPDPKDVWYRDFEEMVTVSGSAYFIRRSVWDELANHPGYREMFPYVEGAFLPTPHYWEETWISYFARYLGHKVYYDGSISIGHSWHASHEQGSEQDKKQPISHKMFREACDRFGIEHD